jgi:dTDP-4-dehydrorhamnose reductase
MKSLSENKTISYPIYDYRGITYVQNVLKNIEKVFLLPGGIYNFGSENELNTYETVKKFINKLGLDEKIIAINEQAFSEKPRNIRMCIDKIKEYGILFPSTGDGLVECAVISNFSFIANQK